jgi:hypothetical protein
VLRSTSVAQEVPCALHAFHPDLYYDSVQEVIDRTIACDNPVFIKTSGRMWPTPEEKQEFIFRLLAQRPWPGAAQA